MTIQEIIESIDYCLECDNDRIPTTQEDLRTIKWALEKQIPKKPVGEQIIGTSITGYKYKGGQCPKCLSTVCHNYCPNCGQALDFDCEQDLDFGDLNGIY